MTDTQVLDYKKEQERELALLKNRIQSGGGDKIRTTQDKQFVTPDGVKAPGPLSMVILDFMYWNKWFDRPYNKDDLTPPACFGFSEQPTGIVPEKISPLLQCEEEEGCNVCPFNLFKSHANGKGKACSNIVSLALVHPDPSKDNKIYILDASATAIKPFGAYVSGIKSQFNALPVGVITQIYFDPGQTYPSLRFGDPAPNPNVAVHWGLRAKAKERLTALPDVSQFKPYEAPKKAGRPAVKK